MKKKAIRANRPMKHQHSAIKGRSRGSTTKKSERDEVSDDTLDTTPAQEFRQTQADKITQRCPGCGQLLTFKGDEFVCENEDCTMEERIKADIKKDEEKKARSNKKWGAVFD